MLFRSVVSPAKIPTGPSYPKPSLNLALGLVLALGAGAASIVLAEILMAGLFTEDEVERRLGLPYLGAVPTLGTTVDDSKVLKGLTPPDYLLAKPLSSFAESLRKLRASILTVMSSGIGGAGTLARKVLTAARSSAAAVQRAQPSRCARTRADSLVPRSPAR